MKKLLRLFDKFFTLPTAYAHCDVPCGIYDPHEAQLAAHTVIRMTSLLEELKTSKPEPDFSERKRIISQISRLTKVKEDHAEIVKHHVRVIWGDYFKPEHLEKYPELNELVFNIMKQASKARQNADMVEAGALLSSVQKFAEIFWKSKERKTVRVKSGYPTEGEIVIPQ